MASTSALLSRKLTSGVKVASQNTDSSAKLALLQRIKNAASAPHSTQEQAAQGSASSLIRFNLDHPSTPMPTLDQASAGIRHFSFVDGKSPRAPVDQPALFLPISSFPHVRINTLEVPDSVVFQVPREQPETSSPPSPGSPALRRRLFRDMSFMPESHGPSRQFHTKRPLTIVTAGGNSRKAFFLDTLALVRRLEAEGLTGKQAEAITHVITDVLHETLDSAGHTFVSKTDMQKSELVAEASMAKLKAELQSTSDVKLAKIQKEVEGLHTDLDKVKSEMRYEVDKVTAGQRLDLNLERGRVKEELNQHAQETSNLSNKMDREVADLKAQLEAAKFEVIRYCVGTLVSVSAVGLGVLRVLM